jgi:hypothetical protein
LKRGAREMLDVVLERGEISREELAGAVGMVASGGTFGTYLGTLRRNNLIDVDGGSIRPAAAFAVAV